MGIGDYMETSDAHLAKDAKDEFVNYVIGLEQTLEEAETYGKKGNIRMLATLGELNSVDDDLQYYAKRANEMPPMRNYHAEISKLICAYLPGILSREIEDIEQFLAQNPDAVGDAVSRLNQLEHIIIFYKELYPELDLNIFEKKIAAMNARFSEQAE